MLEAELRSPAGADDIPPAYADLATAYGDDGDDEDADSDAGQRPAE